MSMQAVGRAGAAERRRSLQQAIMSLILQRGLAPGDAMPTELELVEEFGVGRNTVREALMVLQSMGIVEVRHGYGMFVGRKNLEALAMGLEFHARMSLSHRGDEALEVVEVRQALESGLIGSAMDLMTDEDLGRLEACVVGMERAADEGHMSPELDREFHRLLFVVLDNGLLTRLMEVFWSVYDRIRDQIEEDRPVATQVARTHREIFEVVRAADKDRAAVLLREHFDGLREVLKRADGVPAPPT